MQKPNPLGGYPLTLRNLSEIATRPGELLLDYTSNKIYYVNSLSNNKIDLCKDIYDRIIKYKLANTKTQICKESNTIQSDEEIIPSIGNRDFNTFYMNILQSVTISEE